MMTMNAKALAALAALFFLAALQPMLCRAPDEAVSETNAFQLTLKSRVEQPESGGRYAISAKRAEWNAAATAVVICDMWDKHWCAGATRRVGELAPRINEFAKAARAKGALIVHAPSDTLEHYANHPARRRALAAPKAANLPEGIGGWCRGLENEKKDAWPVDQADGGCDCEPQCKQGKAWSRQVDGIDIRDEDAVSDSGAEIWNLFEQRGIENVLLVGVHTNMCVIGRPFGLRNLTRCGKQVALVRDLTDAMYNPRKKPFVSHFTGTDLVVDYIEAHVCPTILSTDLTGQPRLRFKNDKRPRVVLLSAEGEYGANLTLPELARELELHYGMACEVLQGSTVKMGPERNWIPNMGELENADLAVLFARRRALPAVDMQRLRDYLERGGPLLALRTSSHALAPREQVGDDLAKWETFDQDVLGCKYNNYPHGETRVSIVTAAPHPVLAGLRGPYQCRETLYRSAPLAKSCQVLLMGKVVQGEGDDKRYHVRDDEEHGDQPAVWVNAYGPKQAKVMYSVLGSSRASFQQAWFRRMLINSEHWLMDKPAPEIKVGAGKYVEE